MLNSIIQLPLTLETLLTILLTAVVLGILTALVFLFRGRHSSSFALTLALLPVAVSLIILLVNGNLGAGIAVAGAFTLVRFRSLPGTGREISALFCAMAMGLALGMGYVATAVIFFVIVAVFTLSMTLLHFGAASRERMLRITIPENLDYNHLLEDVFKEYHVKASMEKVRSVSMGTLFEVYYHLTFPSAEIPKNFVDALRARNSNLSIIIGNPEQREML